MPRIREYVNQQDINAGPLASAAGAAEQSGYYQRQAIEGGIGDLRRGLGQVEKYKGEEETASIAKQISDKDMELTKTYETEKANADPNDPNFASNFLEKHVDPALDDIGADAITEEGRAYAEKAKMTLKHGYFQSAFADQVNMAKEARVVNATTALAAVANDSFSSPANTTVNANKIALQALSIPDPTAREKWRLEAMHQNFQSGAEGALQAAVQNPNATPESIEAVKQHIADPKSGFMQNMSPDEFASIMSRFDGAKKTSETVQLTALSASLPDAIRRVQETGQGEDVARAIADQLPAKNPVTQENDRLKANRDIDAAVAQGSATKVVNQLPQADAQKGLDNLNQAIKDEKDPTQLKALFAARDATFKAIRARDAAFASDSAKWVVEKNDTAKAAYAAFTLNPTAQNFQNYAKVSTAIQQNLYPDRVPQVLPPDLRNDIQSKINGIEQSPAGAYQAGKYLMGLRETIGPDWNSAVHELYGRHIISPEQFVAAQIMGRPETQALGQEVLNASMVSDHDLFVTSNVPAVAAEKAMSKAFSDSGLTQTFANTTNGHALMAAEIAAGSRIMRYRGKVDDDTAQSLANAFVLDRFNIRNNLRIPKDYDDHDVANGADVVQAGLKDHNIVPPPSASGFGPALQHDAYVQDVRDFGHWVTNPEGSGAMLYDQFGQPVYENRNGKTVPLAIPYKDLEATGKQNRSLLDQGRRFFTAPETLGGSPLGTPGAVPNIGDIAAAPL